MLQGSPRRLVASFVLGALATSLAACGIAQSRMWAKGYGKDREVRDCPDKACKVQNKYVGICGQGPSDHPELARWLVEQGIDSLSLNPDTVVETWMFLAGDTPAANAGTVTPGGVTPTAKARS